jgi:N-acyl homoserine lactone hydrolase
MIELVLFRTGAVDITRSAFQPWLEGAARDERVVAPVWSALLRTNEGNVVFDTGLHPVHVERPDATFGPQSGLKVLMQNEDAIVARLAALGVKPDDVAIVVNSHLHFDHAGNNGAFPNATFVVQAEHLAFAKGKPNFPGVYWDIPELTYLPTSGRARVAPGVEVVPTPGHAPGHQSLVIETSDGTVVLAGQAVQSRAEWEGASDTATSGEPSAPDRDAYVRSVLRLRALEPIRVHFAHDPQIWELG